VLPKLKQKVRAQGSYQIHGWTAAFYPRRIHIRRDDVMAGEGKDGCHRAGGSRHDLAHPVELRVLPFCYTRKQRLNRVDSSTTHHGCTRELVVVMT
jgi:hypothetical protein